MGGYELPVSRSRHRAWFLTLVIFVGVALSGAEFAICVFRHDNDFLWHRNLGTTFLRNQVYETFGYHYLPGRAMIDAVTAWLPYRLDRAIWLLGAWRGPRSMRPILVAARDSSQRRGT